MLSAVGRRTAIRAALATALLTALVACSSPSADRASSSGPTVPTEPATTTTTDPYAVPAVIDVAYVNRVLAGLDAITGDVVRLVVQTRTIPREAYDRLRAIYTDDHWLQADIDSFQADLRSGLAGYRQQPGNAITTVTRLMTVVSKCIFARVNRDYSAVGTNSSATDTQWIALKPLDQARDPQGYNKTSWALAYNGATPTQSQPPDPCAA